MNTKQLSAAGGKGAPRTALVVECNPDDVLLMRMAAEQVCPDVGFQFVPDASAALAYLNGQDPFADRAQHPFPNLLVLDTRPPALDSWKALEALRRLAHCDSLLVLAWTEEDDADSRARAKAAGVHYFARRPFSFTTLLQEIDHICTLACEGPR